MAKNRRLNENTKIILKTLLRVGVVSTVVLSPVLLPAFGIILVEQKKMKYNCNSKTFINTFYALRRKELIKLERRNKQIYISLTDQGKKKAGKYQIDDLKINKPKKWDGRWRIVIFDINSSKKIVREALRGKLKELEFHQLQKSVWLYPYDCKKEISLLKDFFGLTVAELRILISEDIGEDNEIRKKYAV